MHQNKFFKATLILIISGFITKILSMIIKILVTRTIGTEGIAIYSLVMPTYSLLVSLAIFCMPHAISKLVAEKNISNKTILSSALIIMFLLNLFIIIVVIFSSEFIAVNLLKDIRIKNLLIVCSLSLPFISISSIIKGYYYGTLNMLPNAISNVIEQVVRISLILLLLPIIFRNSLLDSIIFVLFLNVICEVVSIIVLLKFLPNKKIKLYKIKPNISTSKDLLNISALSVSGKLVGNVGFFLEPIILTNLLLYLGYSRDFISTEYGIFMAYSLSLLIMPAFFMSAISQSLIPEITKYHAVNNFKLVKKRFFQAMAFTLLLASSFTFVIYFFHEQLLILLYNTTAGSDYLKLLTPFFVLFYIESPLYSFLLAIDKIKISSIISIVGVLVKLLFLVMFIFLNNGIYSLIYAEIVNIIFVVVSCLIIVYKYFHKY